MSEGEKELRAKREEARRFAIDLARSGDEFASIRRRIESVHGRALLSDRTLYRVINLIRRGKSAEGRRKGSISNIRTKEVIQRARVILAEHEHKISSYQLARILGIGHTCAHRILKDDLKLIKIEHRWLPKGTTLHAFLNSLYDFGGGNHNNLSSNSGLNASNSCRHVASADNDNNHGPNARPNASTDVVAEAEHVVAEIQDQLVEEETSHSHQMSLSVSTAMGSQGSERSKTSFTAAPDVRTVIEDKKIVVEIDLSKVIEDIRRSIRAEMTSGVQKRENLVDNTVPIATTSPAMPTMSSEELVNVPESNILN